MQNNNKKTSFIHIYHLDMLSLAVWQDMCHTYENFVYGIAHHQSPIVQWLSVQPVFLGGSWVRLPFGGGGGGGGSGNSFSEYFDLKILLHYLR